MAKGKTDSIQQMLRDAVGQLPEASTTFHTLATAMPDSRPAILEKLSEIEASADDDYLKALRKTAGTFITPFDREDLFLIVEATDDVIDQLDHLGMLLVGFEVERLPETFVQMSKEIVGMCEALAECVGLIKKHNKLEKHLYSLNEHCGAFDRSYRQLLIESLADASVGTETAKLMALAMGLERASMRLNDLTRAICVTAIKET